MLKVIKSEFSAGFWEDWQKVNANQAIFHQWDQLERTGCIDNFRILAENKDVFRSGWFFADSDAYKWLEAAFRILSNYHNSKLAVLVDEFIDLIEKSQTPDGYLYTFNQIHFPDTRWVNLQIEHELYCHGHLIEAFVSGAELDDYRDKLDIAVKAADCIVLYFQGKGPKHTPGHEEIEIALLRLYEITGHQTYLDMARQFLDMRGKQICFGLNIFRQSTSNSSRVKFVEEQHNAYLASQNIPSENDLPRSNRAKKPGNIQIRWILNALSGKLLQQHEPVQKQSVPVGHAVRFAYLETAAAMVDRITGKKTYRPTLEKSWDRMVDKRMYVTGGIGSLPVIEGFGRDYELDPAYAYAETCAALGSIFWNREMGQLIGEAAYADLYEWQLYNAALVGMGLDGKSYLYNNPLEVRGGIERRSWYEVPCCPSNLSRTIAWLHKDVSTIFEDVIFIEQYFSSSQTIVFEEGELTLEITSDLPWEGRVQIKLSNPPPVPIKLRLRRPTWAGDCILKMNGEIINQFRRATAEVLNPHRAEWLEIHRKWEVGDQVSFEFSMPVTVYRPDERIKSLRGKAALTRGPLVYCLESVDNPGIDIFNLELDPATIKPDFKKDLLGGIWTITGYSIKGELLTFIPYYLWGNRGTSQMTVFIRIKEEE